MGMTNEQQLKVAESYLDHGGSVFRRYCGLGSGQPYCVAFVVTIFSKGGNAELFCNGRKEINCIPAINWCYNNLAVIPIYLALPSDVILFDWNSNDLPDHIGFASERISAEKIYTIEGNTSGGIVAHRTREAGQIQAVFRPHFKAAFDTTKPLAIDGQFGYSSIAMMQIALGMTPNGILDKSTVKALQKKAGVTQDGSWGVRTSKAIQKMCGVEQDGFFGPESVKALQRWINAYAKPQATPSVPNLEPTPVKGIAVDGTMGTATVTASQKLCGTVQDGVISGQLKANRKYFPGIADKAVTFGGGGSLMVERLQAWVGTEIDGVIGPNTVKAWQKKIGAKADGYFGEESVKTWQKFLNTHDKIVVPASVLTIFDKANAWARQIANDSRYGYVVFSDEHWTQECCICHPRNHDLGWNCIGAAFAYWRHGAGIPCKCNCEVINDTMMDRLLRSDHETAVALVKKCTGLTAVAVVSAGGGKPIPTSKLKKGDIIIYYDGNKCAHMGAHIGGGLLFDSARGHSPEIQCGKFNVDWWHKTNGWDVKLAIRFTGKVVA